MMADIKLAQPAAGQRVTVPAEPKARLVLDFPADQATMERPEGSDNLVFKFEDGSSVELQDFYKQYNKDEMPEFEVDGQLIAGADFFEAFGPDLAPAAGPSSSGATRGGRYNEWANANLMDGVNHLDGLDIGFDSEGVESHDEATGGLPDRGGNETDMPVVERNGGDEPTPEPVTERATEVQISTTDTVEGEHSTVTFRVHLTTPPADAASVQVRIGETIYDVAVDAEGNGVLTVETGNDEDVYNDATSVTAEVVGVTGGGYTSAVTGETATAQVLDTINDTTVSITTADINEGEPSIVFNVQLSNPPQGDATVQVKVGETTYDVPVDATGKGTLTLSNTNLEDVYLDASAVTAEVVGVTGGNYENVVTGQTATAQVLDTINDTTVSITTADINEGDPSVVFNVQLSNPPQGDATVQVKIGETTYDVPVDATGKGTLTLDNTNGDDVYLDASAVTAEVVGVTGGSYENVVTGQTATANIADTIDNTTVEITTSDINEGESSVVFNVQLSNPPQGDATVQVKVGETTYDVPVDATGKGTLTLSNTNGDDVYLDASAVTAEVVGVTGGNYENVVTGQTATAQVLDTINDTTVSIKPVDTYENASHVEFDITLSKLPQTAATVTVNVDGTTNEDGTITGGTNYNVQVNADGTAVIKNGAAGSSVSVAEDGTIKLFVKNSFNTDDVYKDPSSVTATITSVTGGNFENVVIGEAAIANIVDTIDVTTASLHVDAIDGSNVTFTIQLSNPPQDGKSVNAYVDVYGDGETPITITKDASGNWTGTFTVNAGDAAKLTATVTKIEGGNYEATHGETVTVALAGGNAALTVDETYLAHGTHDEGDTGAAAASSSLEAFFGQNVEGEKVATYSLEFDSAATGLTAVVDGTAYKIHLVQDGDGRIVGRAYENIFGKDNTVTGQRDVADIFTVEIGANNAVTVALTGKGSLVHDVHGVRGEESNTDGLDEAVSLTGISVVKTLPGSDDSAATVVKKALNLNFEDDAPTLASGGSDGPQYTYYANPGNPDNLKDFGPAIDFTHGKANETHIDLSYWIGSGISLEAGMVHKEVDGSYTLQEAPSNYLVKYSSMNSDTSKPQNYGLTIQGGRMEKEISFNTNNNTGEALVVDLGGKLAYGIDIEFGAFYTGLPTSTGYMTDDTAPETALVIFFRDGEVVGSQHVESSDRDGASQYEFGKLISGGFDKVVIAADDNGTKSNDYVIRSIDFTTEPSDAPVAVVTGTVNADSGADGFKDAAHPVMFDRGADLVDNGFDAVVNGKEVHVDVALSSGDMFIKATYDVNAGVEGSAPDERTLFVGTVDSEGHWTLKQYAEFTVKSGDGQTATFTLPLRTGEDFDGDYAVMDIDIKTVKDGDAGNVTKAHAFKVTIDDGLKGQDHVLGFDESGQFSSVKVDVQVDHNHLFDEAVVTLNVESGASQTVHTLTWNATAAAFGGMPEGMTYNTDTGVISWSETAIPGFGKLLNISASQTVKDEVSGEVFTVSDSDYTQPEIITVLNSVGSLAMREIGVHGGGNYLCNKNAGDGWDIAIGQDASGIYDTSGGQVAKSGTFAVDGYTDAYGLKFSLTAKSGIFSETENADGTITLTYTNGLSANNVPLSEGFFSITYNPITGAYTAVLDNSNPLTEDGKWNWNKSLSVDFAVKVTTGGDDSFTFAAKDFRFTLQGANERPELHQVDASGNAVTEVVVGNTGRVLSSESADIADELRSADLADSGTQYYVFKQGAANTFTSRVKTNGSLDSTWARGEDGTLRYSGEELLYTEKNLHTWLKDYTEKAGTGVTEIESDRSNSLLSTPSDKTYADSVKGAFGTLTINTTTGEYNYAVDAAAVAAVGGAVEETFHLLVKDTKGAFDIKDVTFKVVDTDGELVCLNGSPDMFAFDATVSGSSANDALAGNTGNDAIFAGAGDDILSGNEGNDLLFGGSGKDVLQGDAGNDTLHGDEGLDASNAEGAPGIGGDDLLFGGAGDDLLFGGAGNDYLDGGTGADRLYGGAGDDVIAFDGDDVVINGGSGIDFLVGEGSTDALLNRGDHADMNITDVEAAIDTKMSLTSMDDIAEKLGITVDGKGVSVDSSQWVQNTEQSTDAFAVFDHVPPDEGGESDATLVVAKAVVENGNV